MAEHPLKVLERMDPDFLKAVESGRSFALSDGALPRKVKLLIALALDAAAGTSDGVNSLAQQAIKTGATKEEIADTLRVAHYISGVGSTYTAAHGLKDLF